MAVTAPRYGSHAEAFKADGLLLKDNAASSSTIQVSVFVVVVFLLVSDREVVALSSI